MFMAQLPGTAALSGMKQWQPASFTMTMSAFMSSLQLAWYRQTAHTQNKHSGQNCPGSEFIYHINPLLPEIMRPNWCSWHHCASSDALINNIPVIFSTLFLCETNQQIFHWKPNQPDNERDPVFLIIHQANTDVWWSALCICQNAFLGKTLSAKAYHAPLKRSDRNRRKQQNAEWSWTARRVLTNWKNIHISAPGQARQTLAIISGKTIRLNKASPVIVNNSGTLSIPSNPVTETGCDIMMNTVRPMRTGWFTPYNPLRDSWSDQNETTLTFQLMRTKLPSPKCRCRLMYLSHKPVYLMFWISNLISGT